MNKNADFFQEIIVQQGGDTTPRISLFTSAISCFFQLQTGSFSRYVIVIAFAFLIKKYHTIDFYFFYTLHFADSALLCAVFLLESISSTFGLIISQENVNGA